MKIFVSSTWHGTEQSRLGDVLSRMAGLEIDGVELGSTHRWQADLLEVVRAGTDRALFTHNYFPPARDDIVLNIASNNDQIRTASIAHAGAAIKFAADAGASLYTIHPGFLSDAEMPIADAQSETPYDFVFADDWADFGIAQKHLRAALQTLLADAEKHGVKLAVETQGSFVDTGISLLERLPDFDALSDLFKSGLGINFNFAHSWFAAKAHGFSFEQLIETCRPYLAAVELSHNDGTNDYHQALVTGSYVLDWLDRFGDTPLILEFRDASRSDIERSIALVRQAAGSGNIRSSRHGA